MDDIQASLANVSPSVIAATLAAVFIGLNTVVRLVTKHNEGFKRDAFARSSFANPFASVSILSNKDSVLTRDKVGTSMQQYDELFAGARTDVGSLQQEESIKKREKEYKTMINNFYDLVTDFYEWGWGQVSLPFILRRWWWWCSIRLVHKG